MRYVFTVSASRPGPGRTEPGGAADAAAGVPASVGARLRSGRVASGMSVRELARRAGVSASLISQVENGRSNPSVGTLYAIVSALGMSLDALFFDGDRGSIAQRGDTPSASPAPTSTDVILRRGDRPVLPLAAGVRWERLTSAPDPQVDFLLVTYEVGGASCPPDALMRHRGREYGLVLEGRLGATVGPDAYVLEPGDSIVFDSATPHRFCTIGDAPAVVLWTVLGRGGDPRAALQAPARGG